MAGFNVESMTSAHSTRERESAIRRFNDPNADIDVFLCGMNLASYGINLHKAAWNGVFIQYHWNAGIVNQAIARLVRYDQSMPVKWQILKVKDTFYDVMENRMIKKWAPQVSAETAFEDYIRGTLRDICTYELVSMTYGLPWNRYV